MTTADQVNAANAYRYSDNYQIVRESTDQCIGCEHNETEAKAVAAYMSNYHGGKFVVVRNGVDAVRAGKALRNGTPFQVRNRDIILKDMGVW